MRGRKSMKREGLFICSVLIGSLLIPACRKAQDGSSPPAAAVIAEINETAVSEATGVKIRVLKVESVGISPVNRFYWIQVEGRPLKDKLLEISGSPWIKSSPRIRSCITALPFISLPRMNRGERRI